MAFDIKKLKVIIIEEQMVLLSSMSNMLKSMGFRDENIHKAPNYVTFNRLTKTNNYHLMICNYSAKGHIVGRKYQHLFYQSPFYSHECAFVFVTENLQDKEKMQMLDLQPDAVIEIPFNYNQLETTVNESLKKRQAFVTISNHLTKGNLEQATKVCKTLGDKNPSWLVDLNKILIGHHIDSNNLSLAMRLLIALRQKSPNEWVLLKMIELYSGAGDKEAALSLAQEYEALGYPEHHLITQITAYNSILESNMTEAVSALKQITIRYPHLIDASINLAYLTIASNDYQTTYKNLGRVDPELILREEQFLCIEEIKLSLEVIAQLQSGNKVTNQRLRNRIERFMSCHGETIDNPTITKSLYKTILDVIAKNPVCSYARLHRIWNNTKLSHRKLMVMGLAYHLGFVDELAQWVCEENQRLKKVRTIDAAVTTTIYNKIDELKNEKSHRLAKAYEMKREGRILEPLAIKSKEVPGLITHHLDFVNAMLSNRLDSSHNVDDLWVQFQSSTEILIKHLQRHNPTHPKIDVIKKIQKRVRSKVTTASGR